MLLLVQAIFIQGSCQKSDIRSKKDHVLSFPQFRGECEVNHSALSFVVRVFKKEGQWLVEAQRHRGDCLAWKAFYDALYDRLAKDKIIENPRPVRVVMRYSDVCV
jgi:hypothetical protein